MRRWLPPLLVLAAPMAMAAAQNAPETWREPTTSMSFVQVGKGCFRMGTKGAPFKLGNQTLREVGYAGDVFADERPEHEACISPFWIGQFEVRADEWERVMKAPPPRGEGREPAAGVSWTEAVEFAERLTALAEDKSRFRLPTEAEWEMACHAGKPAEPLKDYTDRVSLANYAVFNRSGKEGRLAPHPRPVGSLKANAWGIFDLLGNVAEWVQDSYTRDGYAKHGLFDPLVADKAGLRVLRGGSHRTEVMYLRCARRGWYPEAESLPAIGFRLVRQAAP